ncbi:S8 family serine peptidase [Streptosporangium sp. 'caverna']|uniref:S8 family serine peptidase n=1 Tax=Streptosporangium sp. 'caverna' TaxID=2202249 RepID=UPI0019550CBA|nr:S8 family serine peptidase [Streptosporangium sp. 'caverna']
MSQFPSRGRGLLAVGAVLTLLTTAWPSSSAGASSAGAVPAGATQAAAAAGAQPGARTRTVTLITGDKVTATTTADGRTTATVRKPTGGPAGAHIMSVGEDTYVYPDAAMPYVASGVLDEGLFNVSDLLADGYDDAQSDHLPLIVSYADARKQVVPTGARRTRTLSSIQGAAMVADRKDPTAFWTSLTDATAARGTGTAKTLAGGIAKVWLDGKARVALADSTAQIGAPQVWQGGNTGQDVDVAVLDTGIDAAHPDLAGQIAASASFIPGQDITDRNGHGTHVASTIAGTGAASGGKEKGVAPGASLHIGKVLAEDGSGQDSWILAGMEWAARDQHAKVINMSLGAGPTDGSDPLSQAVNRLSAETGALFVIAAGNSGPAPFSVGAPGVADAALTVGAVDSTDRLASFSSRGPRLGDNGLKPELTAPGVGILAARSQYAPEGEGSYVAMDGTSMATPHVAGAAALLARTHPDWTGAQLKDALVSTTKRTAQIAPYAGGGGRLDIDSAVKSTVFATGSAFLFTKWPYPSSGLVSKDIVYTNTGAEPVTLDLAITAQGIPDGLLTLTSSQVTVPAHGTATVGVQGRLDLAADDGGYSAMLTATGPGGELHTPVALSKQSERVTLSVDTKDRDGSTLPGLVILKDVRRDTAPQAYEIDESGRLDLTLRPSTYSLWMYADVRGLDGPHSLARAVLSDPEVVLGKDRTLTLDASTLRKVEAIAPQPTGNNGLRIDQERSYPDLYPFFDSYQLEWWLYDSVWATPTRKVTQGAYAVTTRWRQEQPAVTLASGKDSWTPKVQVLSPKLAAGTRSASLVYVGDGSSEDFRRASVRGRIAVVLRNDRVPATEQAKSATEAGAQQLLIVHDGYGPLDAWADKPLEEAPQLPVASLSTDQGQRLLAELRHGSKTVKLTSHPYPEYLYDLVQHHDGAIPRDPGYRPGTRDLAKIEQSFRNIWQGEALDIRYDLSPDLTWAVGPASSTLLAQGDHTVWVTAGPKVKWLSQSAVPGQLSEFGSSRSYPARSTTEETWFAGIQRPRLLSDNVMSTPPSRIGDLINVFGMPSWGSGPHEGTVFDGITVNTSLYQGDKLVGEGSDMLFAEVAPDRLPYRLVVDATRSLPKWPYSPRTRTEWGFVSDQAHYAEMETLPLIQLDYGVSTDLAGRADRRAELSVTPSHLGGAAGAGKINSVTLEVSYDDGAGWRTLKTSRSGTGWRVRLDAPSKARYAGLRTTARDAAGNSVVQTVERAFGLN